MTSPISNSTIAKLLNILCLVFGLTVFQSSYAVDIGFSSSGKDVSADIWIQKPDASRWGGYSRFVFDFDQYKNGSYVSVCKDGAISGTIGSGACSGHSGVSSTRLAEFGRFAIVFGASYWIGNSIQVHGDILAGTYSSDINIGEKGKLDYGKLGLEFGVSWKVVSDFKILISHETEQGRSSVGVRFPIAF